MFPNIRVLGDLHLAMTGLFQRTWNLFDNFDWGGQKWYALQVGDINWREEQLLLD